MSTQLQNHLSIHAASEGAKQGIAERLKQLDFDVPVSLVLDDRPGYALQALARLGEPLPVLLVTANRSPHYLLDLLEYEPQGLLVTSNLPPARALAFYLSRVAIGEHFYEGPPPTKSPLTPREREVLRRTMYGESVETLARSLGIIPYTAGEHLRHIREKLGVERNAELVLAYFAGDTAQLAV